MRKTNHGSANEKELGSRPAGSRRVKVAPATSGGSGDFDRVTQSRSGDFDRAKQSRRGSSRLYVDQSIDPDSRVQSHDQYEWPVNGEYASQPPPSPTRRSRIAATFRHSSPRSSLKNPNSKTKKRACRRVRFADEDTEGARVAGGVLMPRNHFLSTVWPKVIVVALTFELVLFPMRLPWPVPWYWDVSVDFVFVAEIAITFRSAFVMPGGILEVRRVTGGVRVGVGGRSVGGGTRAASGRRRASGHAGGHGRCRSASGWG